MWLSDVVEKVTVIASNEYNIGEEGGEEENGGHLVVLVRTNVEEDIGE